MQTVIYKNYTVTRLNSGAIKATNDGHDASIVKPLLRELAQELNVNIENKNGNAYNTQQLGVLVMKAIEKQEPMQSTQSHDEREIVKPINDECYSQRHNKNISHISFMNAIKQIVSNSPLTPQEIRDEIEKNYSYLYGTETHHKNVDKGHYQHIAHAVLAQIYSQTKDNKDFLIDKSTKPLTIGLSNHIKLSISKLEGLIKSYKLRNEHGFFYLNKEKKIEKVLTENNVPNQYGVYIIYSVKDSQEELIYIGKAGTIATNGDFKRQGIKDRLKAVTTNNMQRGKYFQQEVIQKYGFDKLKFVWIVTFDDTRKELPACSEAKLMQLYYDDYHELPMLNKSF